jgi:hypothetical protein
MNQCIKCGRELTLTSEIGGICIYCQNENTAQYRTYENGFADGYKAAQDNLLKAWEELGRAMAVVPIRYIVVTQEKYDEMIKK